MSTLRVNNVAEAGGAPVITSGVLDSGSLPTIPADKLPTGSIIKTTSITKTDTWSASVGDGGNSAVTGLEISYAMSNASNKLIMIGMFGVCAHSLNVNQIAMGFNRVGTGLIGVGPQVSGTSPVTAGGRSAGSADAQNAHSITAVWQYEPGTTDSVTYQMVAINLRDDTRTLYVNRNTADTNSSESPRGISTFTIMEIAG